MNPVVKQNITLGLFLTNNGAQARSMTKEYRLNIRINQPFKENLQAVAQYHGLSVSSYVHSVLVKQIRQEFKELDGIIAANSQMPDQRLVRDNPPMIEQDRTANAKDYGSIPDETAIEPKRKTG